MRLGQAVSCLPPLLGNAKTTFLIDLKSSSPKTVRPTSSDPSSSIKYQDHSVIPRVQRIPRFKNYPLQIPSFFTPSAGYASGFFSATGADEAGGVNPAARMTSWSAATVSGDGLKFPTR